MGTVTYLLGDIVGLQNVRHGHGGNAPLPSSVTLVVALFFGAVALFAIPNASLALISAVTIGAMLGFLIYNHHPAQVFMGDTGSLFLGGIVIGSAFIINEPIIIIIAGGIYIFEVISDILQVSYFKLTKGKRIFKCAPVHHHFEACGWSEVKIVVVFSLATAALCVLAWFGL